MFYPTEVIALREVHIYHICNQRGAFFFVTFKRVMSPGRTGELLCVFKSTPVRASAQSGYFSDGGGGGGGGSDQSRSSSVQIQSRGHPPAGKAQAAELYEKT